MPWGSPAPATQLGGGNQHLQPKHYKQNNPHGYSGTGPELPSEAVYTRTHTHTHACTHTTHPNLRALSRTLLLSSSAHVAAWQKAGAWPKGGDLVQHVHFQRLYYCSFWFVFFFPVCFLFGCLLGFFWRGGGL